MPYDVDIGDGADALGQNQLSDALDGTYWVSGWDATLGTGDLEVDIAAGSGAVDGTDVSTGSTQTIDFTGDPDSTDARKAVIYVDSGGAVQKSLGTPQPVDPSGEIRFRTWNPSPPASVPGVVVAEVWLAAGETVLESADIQDRRVTNDASINATPNEPDFIEDGNSPYIASNTTSITCNLADSFDYIIVFLKVIDSNNNDPLVSLILNGDTGTNYDWYAPGGVLTEGDSNFPQVAFGPMSFGSEKFSISLENGVNVKRQTPAPFTNRFHFGSNGNISWPVTSLTFDSGTDAADWAVEIYGQNIG